MIERGDMLSEVATSQVDDSKRGLDISGSRSIIVDGIK